MTFAVAPVSRDPFPHVLQDNYLEPDLYRALADSFPECPPATGPTGFTSYWGDPDYDALLAASPAWRALFDRFHSQAFVDHALAQFGETFASESVHDLSRARYVPYLESRADKERAKIRDVRHAPDELWVRVDIMQGRTGFDRGVHLDHRRRAATLLIYFSDAEENEMEGGELVLHGPAGADAARVIAPRSNRSVFFPCCNASRHSVSPIRAQARPRDVVQVTLSSSVDLWRPLPGPSPLARAAGRVARLFGQRSATNA